MRHTRVKKQADARLTPSSQVPLTSVSLPKYTDAAGTKKKCSMSEQGTGVLDWWMDDEGEDTEMTG